MPRKLLAAPIQVSVGAIIALRLFVAFAPQEPDRPRPADRKKAFGGPGGFGPGTFLAPQVFQIADTDKDSKVSADEAATAAERLVHEADADGKGSIDVDALAGAINRRMGPPPGFGPGGPGGPGGGDRPILKRFDANGDGVLNAGERRAARVALKSEQPEGGRPRFGPPPGFGGEDEPDATPGPRLSPADVQAYPEAPLYEPTVLRTLFLRFEEDDWEAELEEFHGTDADVLASLVVDGKEYRGVGVRFRGMSSYGMVRAGHKRSLNLSLDLVDPKQRLHGYKTLNLLNAHEDPSLLHTVLYSQIARRYIPAPKANFVRVVINGESWGVYANAQQFDRLFVEENFPGGGKGARWKVPGSPGGDGGLGYVGDKLEDYQRRYEMKSGKAEDWKALIALCRTLSETPADQLEASLGPLLDIEGALRFLALDVALINGDGYWTRASDYSLYRDPKGVFHVVPHDMNEAFGPAMGPGFGPPPGGPGGGPGGPGGRGRGPRGPGGFGPGTFLAPQILKFADADGDDRLSPGEAAAAARRWFAENDGGKSGLDAAALAQAINRSAGPPPGFGPGGPGGPGGGPGGPPGFGPRPVSFDLEPLVGLDDERKPLRSKLLAVPALRARYLAIVRSIAEDALDWKQLGPVVAQYRRLIGPEVEADTRKLTSTAAFQAAVSDAAQPEPGPARGRPSPSLRAFAEGRRAYLLEHTPAPDQK